MNKCGLRLIQTNTQGILGNRERKGETYAPGKGKTAFINTMYLHHLLMSPPPSPQPGPTYSFLPKESNTMETDPLNMISKGASVCWQQLVPKCGHSFKGTSLLTNHVLSTRYSKLKKRKNNNRGLCFKMLP